MIIKKVRVKIVDVIIVLFSFMVRLVVPHHYEDKIKRKK